MLVHASYNHQNNYVLYSTRVSEYERVVYFCFKEVHTKIIKL